METATIEKPRKRRPKGTGSIFHPKYKDRHGTLRECRNFWIQYYRNGRICRENTSSPVKKVAEGLLKKRLGQIEMGQSFAPKVEQILFDELADDLRAEYRKGENRIDRLEQSLAKLQAHFGGIRMAGIGTTLLNGYIVLRQCRSGDEGAHPKLSTAASNATINRELAALKRMFYHGMEQDPPKVLRVPTIKMLPEPEAKEGVIANDQYQALIRELPGYLRAFLATLYFTGMRFREALWLRWSEIDWLKRTIRLPRRRTKNKSPKIGRASCRERV